MVNRDPERVRQMFASIAPRYDCLNRLLSLRVDQRWRRRTVSMLRERIGPEARVLDLCTGTGDLALALAPPLRVVGADFCHPMLVLGAGKAARVSPRPPIDFVESDALRLPFPAGAFEGLTVAFGLRNLADYRAGLREMARVIEPGGVCGVLEFSVPQAPFFKQLYLFYFTRVLPLIGRLLSGRDGPYRYLPDSVTEFPDSPRLAALMMEIGFADVKRTALSGGIAMLYVATRGQGSAGED